MAWHGMVVCVAHQVFDKNTGSFVRQFGSVGRARGQLQNPYGVAVDGEGETCPHHHAAAAAFGHT